MPKEAAGLLLEAHQHPAVALVGGIEPTVFLNSSLPELEEYTAHLLEKMKGSRYVLANSDSCPPGVSMEKFRLVSRLAAKTAI